MTIPILSSLLDVLRHWQRIEQRTLRIQEALGRIEARQVTASSAVRFTDAEFKAFSQFGEDGLIHWLVSKVPISRKMFVEFGVENYEEANTRFLLLNGNWTGLVMDGSDQNIQHIRQQDLYWRHNLKAQTAFITRENINGLMRQNGIEGEIGLLSIDIDGNDYWVWEAIDSVSPAIVIIEYNSRLGPDRAVTVPYDPGFDRRKAHWSMIYYGASLAALCKLGRRKGYAFVGANSAGNNAFFVRRDLLPAAVREVSVAEGFVQCQFREARNPEGRLQFLDSSQERELLEALPWVEIAY